MSGSRVGSPPLLARRLSTSGHVATLSSARPGRRRERELQAPAGVGGGLACCRMPPPLATIVLVVSTVLGIAEACSSRSTPKPRPPSPTARPNITFHTYECPPAYANWYCLNGATCFTVNIGESLLYNCECADGYMGQRCEFKDLDGSYLPSRQRVMLETASIAGGATIAVFLVVIVCICVYIRLQRKLKESRASCTDGSSHDLEKRPFSRDPVEVLVRRPAQFQNSSDLPASPLSPGSTVVGAHVLRLQQ
ncbi:probetacellulin isoform X2 [Anabrus simplex]|uniref:probetacellulin isoform X2 n=1 Tax=Anabrus simplex TaxID=316456 RepID=UPI0034DD34A0